MTSDELQAIKACAERATPGPWHYDSYRTVFRASGPADDDICTVPQRERSADAVFIALAREDIPHLLAEVERLSNELDELHWDQTGESR